jgi:hypothetical protein
MSSRREVLEVRWTELFAWAELWNARLRRLWLSLGGSSGAFRGFRHFVGDEKERVQVLRISFWRWVSLQD